MRRWRENLWVRVIARVLFSTIGVAIAVNLFSNNFKLGVPGSAALMLGLGFILVLLEREPKKPVSTAAPSVTLSATPPALPIRFVPPGDVLAQVKKALGGPLDQEPTVALSGPGGIGKTTLASVVANDKELFPGSVFWWRLQDGAGLSQLLTTWIARNGQAAGDLGPDDLIDLTRQLLDARVARQGRVLLVLDDASENTMPTVLEARKVLRPGVSLLVTTQNRETAVRCCSQVIPIPFLSGPEELDLFTKICPYSESGAQARIFQVTKGHPLAITLAAEQAALVVGQTGGMDRLADDLARNAASALRGGSGSPGIDGTLRVAYQRLRRPMRRMFRAACALAEAPFPAADAAMLVRVRSWTSFGRRPLLALRRPLAMAGLRPLVPVSARTLNTCKDQLNELDRLSFIKHEADRYTVFPVLRSFGRLHDSRWFPGRFRIAFRQLFLTYLQAYQATTPQALIALGSQLHNLLAATREAYADKRWHDVVTFVVNLNSPEYPFLADRAPAQVEREILDLGVKAARRTRDKVAVADFTGNLAIRLFNARMFDEAGEKFQEAERLYTQLGLTGQVALAQFYQAQVAGQLDDLAAAKRLYRSAITLAGNSSSVPEAEKPGFVFRAISRFRGEAFASQVMRQLGMDRERRNVGMEENAYEELGLMAERNGDLAEARDLFREAVAQSERNRRPTHQLRNLGHMGRVALAAGQREEAEQLYDTAQRILPGISHPEDYSRGAESIAELARQLGLSEEAGNWLRAGYRRVREFNEPRRAEMALALGRHLMETEEEPARAEIARLAQEALDFYLARESADAVNAIAARDLLASMRLADGDLRGAADHLTEAESACRAGRRPAELLMILQRLAPIEQNLGELAKAARHHDECVQLAERLHEPQALAEALLSSAEVTAQQGRIAAAAQTLDRHDALVADPPAGDRQRVLSLRVQFSTWRLSFPDAAAMAEEMQSRAQPDDPFSQLMAADSALLVARVRGDRQAVSLALAAGDRAAATLDVDGTRITRQLLRSTAELDAAHFSTAAELLDEAEVAQPADHPAQRWIAETRADIDRHIGRWDAALAAYARLNDEYRAEESVVGRIAVAIARGTIFVRAHEPTRAIECLEPAMQEMLAAGTMLPVLEIHLALTAAYQEKGELSAARFHAIRALAAAQASRSPLFKASAHATLVRQARCERRPRLARSHLEALRQLANVTQHPEQRADILDLDARLADDQGDTEAAKAYQTTCLARREAIGAIPEIIESLTCLADISGRRGDAESAVRFWRDACSRAGELGAVAEGWRAALTTKLIAAEARLTGRVTDPSGA